MRVSLSVAPQPHAQIRRALDTDPVRPQKPTPQYTEYQRFISDGKKANLSHVRYLARLA